MAPAATPATAACPRVTAVAEQLLLGGLGGGLGPEAVGCLLQEHAVTHLVVCGHRGADAHADAAVTAAAASGAELHVAPLVPAEAAEAPAVLEAARAFVEGALEDDLNCVLVACKKGASRSVAVVLAHLMAARGVTLMDAFDTVTSRRWCVWPSALLVEALLKLDSARRARASEPPLCDAGRAATVRRIGAHAAWATARHNGVQAAELQAAEAAWDRASKGGGPLENAFARCKQEVLGLAGVDLASFGASGARPAPPPPPHVEVHEVRPSLLICGLGGLSVTQVASLLRDHRVARVVVCGRLGRDAHVRAASEAAEELGLADQGGAVLVVPVADSASEDIGAHFVTASAFISAALGASESGKVLVACRQGASRSAAVIMAHLMSSEGVSVLEAFQLLSSQRWRLWPNAGFVEQLLQLQERLAGTAAAAAPAAVDRAGTLKAIGAHAAWATNRQNLEEGGVGRPGLRLEDAEELWGQAAGRAASAAEAFELCKAMALGVDLRAFEAGMGGAEEAGPPAKRASLSPAAPLG